MSDPNYGSSDPRTSDPRDYRRPELGRDAGEVNSVWGWIAAAVFVGAVLLFVFASGGNNAPSNTGVSMPPTASAPPLPPAQRSPSQTTGAAPSTPAPHGGNGQ